LPRFLAIQQAYEQLATSRVRTVRGGGGRPPASQPAAEPWRADPDRAQRAREAAREAARQRAEQARRAPGTEAGGSTAGTGRRPGSRSRQTRKATLGSTSYDEARDPLDPAWGGAAWYGPTSGEYWTVNPREYADPRKHGPEYQARGRRLHTTPTGRAGDEVRVEDAGPEDVAGAEDLTAAAGGTAGAEAASPGASAPRNRDRRSRGAQARPRDRWSFDPDAATGSGWSDAHNPEAAQAGAAAGSAGATAGPAGSAAGTHRDARRWATVSPPDPAVAGDRDVTEAGPLGRTVARDPLGRLGLALVAWPPLAIAIASVVGSLTGCAEFSATCSGAAPMLPWLGQVLLLGVLLLAPPLSRALAMGTLAVIIALVPITAVLVAFGGGFDPLGGPVLADLLVVAWLVGVVYGIVSRTRPSALS
jgi:hypothetical protein